MIASNINAPTNLELSKMIGSLDQNESIVKGCRFVVRINLAGPLLQRLTKWNEIPSNLLYACEAAEFPGRGFQTTEVRYYGPKQMFPNNTIYGDGISLSFICRSKTMERQVFDDWMDIINPTTSYHFKYPNQYWTDIEIFQYAEFGALTGSLSASSPVKGIPGTANPQNTYSPQPIYAWKLLKAWPTLVAPQQVTWAETDALRLQVTFAYKNWIRQGDTEKIISKI